MQLMRKTGLALVVFISALGVTGAYAEEIGTAPVQQNDTTIIYGDTSAPAVIVEKKGGSAVKPVKKEPAQPQDTLVIKGQPMFVGVGIGCRVTPTQDPLLWVDPFISTVVSIPVKISFFHIDAGADYIRRIFLYEGYTRTQLNYYDDISQISTYTRSYVTNLESEIMVLRAIPSLYVDRYHFGVGLQFKFQTETADRVVDTIELGSNYVLSRTLVHDKKGQEAGVINPVFAFGVHLWDLDVSLLHELPFEGIAIRIHYLFRKGRPHIFSGFIREIQKQAYRNP